METGSEPLASEDILGEVKRSLRSRDVVNVEEEPVKLVIFTLGEGRYAFYGSEVREILSGCEVFPVQFLPGYLPGLINIRGDIESAVDLRHILGKDKTPPGKALIIMAERGEFKSGIIIDAVEDVADLPQSKITPPLATLTGTARDLAAGTVELGGGQTATLIDIEKLAAMVAL